MLAFEPVAVLPATAGLTMVLCFILVPLAERFNLLDHPGERKVHKSATPLLGGWAIYLAMALAVILSTPYRYDVLPLMAACGLMLVTGTLDDLHDLSPRLRFVLQIIACCIMIFASGVVLTDFGSLMWNGVLPLGPLSIPITIFAALGVINAFNMMDGIDGLSSTIFIVATAAMAWLAMQAGHTLNAGMLLIALAGAAGFFLINARLPWNRRARVFLGDSGSLFLGMFLAWQFIDLGNGADRAFAPMTAVWILGIPLVDTLRLMTQRWMRGGSSMAADQYHLHHAFLKAGFSVLQTSIAMAVLFILTAAIGLAGEVLQAPEYGMFYGYIAFCLLYLYIMRKCWRHGRFLGRDVAQELTQGG